MIQPHQRPGHPPCRSGRAALCGRVPALLPIPLLALLLLLAPGARPPQAGVVQTNALAFGQTAGAADHFLPQRKTFTAVGRILRQAEQRRCWQTERLARLGGEATADNQRNAATGAHFVENHRCLE